MKRRLESLTERVLARLPGPRAFWIGAWALVPAVNAVGNLLLEPDERSAVWEQGRALVALSYAAVAFAVVVTLLGTERIARRLDGLRAATGRVLDVDPPRHFREVNGVAVPLLAATALAAAFGANALVRDGAAAAILRGTTWFVLGIAFCTFVWTYASLQIGLGRLGREPLHPDAARVDPNLGLRPLGDVAFMGLWLLMLWLVPVVLTALSDVVGVATGLGVLAAALAAFFLSLHRLHRRMAELKARELALARELYAQAYEPIGEARTLAALERQQPLLGAADALEKRADAIREWPIDDGTLARVITIATSVTATFIARLILEPVGL